MIKINELENGDILNYNPTSKKFEVSTSNGELLFSSDTQDKVEERYQRYLKSLTKSKCPIHTVYCFSLYTITSYDEETGNVWIKSEEASTYRTLGERSKNNLYDYTNKPKFYEITEFNKTLIKRHTELQEQIAKLTREDRALENQFEKPITKEYFKV